jgi:hypothetical protein
MTEISAENLLKRHARAMTRAEQWRDLLDFAYYYSMPQRNPWDMNVTPGEERGVNLYDMTLPLATQKFVNRTIQALFPPQIEWLKFIPGERIEEEDKEEVAKLLQKDTKDFFFYLEQSNFDVVIQEALEDMAVSTGVLQINEGPDDDPLIFSAVPNDKVGLETGPNGDFSGFFREWKDLPLEQLNELWGDDLVIPEQALNQSDPRTINIKECSYKDFKTEKYEYYVVASDFKEIMLQKTQESWPWLGFRWSRRSGEDRGRGPAMMASYTAATINKAMEDELRSAALKASPPFMAYHEYVINPWNFKVEPNTIIPVNPLGTETWPIAPLPIAGDITFTAIVLNDLRAQIQEMMFTQPLQPLQNEPVRTATEVAIKQGEMRENQGTSYSRVQRELLVPLVRRMTFILQKKGLMRKNLKVDGKEVAISFQTPLSTSKDANEVQNFMEYFQIISALFTPGIAINLLDAPKIPQWVGEKLNSNLSLIKNEEEIKKLIQQAAEAALGAIEQQQPGPQEQPPSLSLPQQ